MKKAFTLGEILIGISVVIVVVAALAIVSRASGNYEIIDNTKSSFSNETKVINLDTETTNLDTDIDLNSCKELVIHNYNNRMKVHCRR